jgi:DNA-binding beta-propeller fold protein YncE
MSFLRKIILLSLVLCFTIAVFGNFVFIDIVEVGRESTCLAVNPETNRIYVTTYVEDGQLDGGVSVIDGETNSVIANL